MRWKSWRIAACFGDVRARLRSLWAQQPLLSDFRESRAVVRIFRSVAVVSPCGLSQDQRRLARDLVVDAAICVMAAGSQDSRLSQEYPRAGRPRGGEGGC